MIWTSRVSFSEGTPGKWDQLLPKYDLIEDLFSANGLMETTAKTRGPQPSAALQETPDLDLERATCTFVADKKWGTRRTRVFGLSEGSAFSLNSFPALSELCSWLNLRREKQELHSSDGAETLIPRLGCRTQPVHGLLSLFVGHKPNPNKHFRAAVPLSRPAQPVLYLLEVGDLIQGQTLLFLDGMLQGLLHVLHQEVEGSRILQGQGDGSEATGRCPWLQAGSFCPAPLSLLGLGTSEL